MSSKIKCVKFHLFPTPAAILIITLTPDVYLGIQHFKAVIKDLLIKYNSLQNKLGKITHSALFYFWLEIIVSKEIRMRKIYFVDIQEKTITTF